MKIGDEVIAVIHERHTINGIPQCTEGKKPVPIWNKTEKEAVIVNIVERSKNFFNITVSVGENRYSLREENIKPRKTVGGLGF
jgi:hypothetical protein